MRWSVLFCLPWRESQGMFSQHRQWNMPSTACYREDIQKSMFSKCLFVSCHAMFTTTGVPPQCFSPMKRIRGRGAGRERRRRKREKGGEKCRSRVNGEEKSRKCHAGKRKHIEMRWEYKRVWALLQAAKERQRNADEWEREEKAPKTGQSRESPSPCPPPSPWSLPEKEQEKAH